MNYEIHCTDEPTLFFNLGESGGGGEKKAKIP
jgi:hypothetical protein